LEFRVYAVSIRLKAEFVIDDHPVRNISPDEKMIALPPLFMVEATRGHRPVGEQPAIRFRQCIGPPEAIAEWDRLREAISHPQD